MPTTAGTTYQLSFKFGKGKAVTIHINGKVLLNQPYSAPIGDHNVVPYSCTVLFTATSSKTHLQLGGFFYLAKVWGGIGPDHTVPSTPRPLTYT